MILGQQKHQESKLAPLCHPDRSEAQWRDLQFPSQISISARKANGRPFVIPTEAYPDFLLRSTKQVHVCGFP